MLTHRSKIVTIASAGLALGCAGLTSDPAPDIAMNAVIKGTDVDGVCAITPAYTCPPPEDGITCEAPPTTEQDCPPTIKMAIQKQDAETCALELRFDCPLDTICYGVPSIETPCPEEMGAFTRLVKHTPYGCAQVDEGNPDTYQDDVYNVVACPPILERPPDEGWSISPTAEENGLCMAILDDMGCPPPDEGTCNPPPPSNVPCPE